MTSMAANSAFFLIIGSFAFLVLNGIEFLADSFLDGLLDESIEFLGPHVVRLALASLVTISYLPLPLLVVIGRLKAACFRL